MDAPYTSPALSNTAAEYYGRILRLKPVILADRALISRIKGAFMHKYLEDALPEDVLMLGGGESHSVYSVGGMEDPLDGRKIHVAVRLSKKTPYMLEMHQIRRELGAFERAFVEGKNPPHFSGIVVWNNAGLQSLESQSAAIITEDIRMGKIFRLLCKDRESVTRANPDGSSETFFIDPLDYETEIDDEAGEKYASDEARIDLPW